MLLVGKTFNNDTEELRAFSKCKDTMEKLQALLAPSERRRKDDNAVSGQWGAVMPSQWKALAGLLKHFVLPFKGRKKEASPTLQQTRFAAARCLSILVSATPVVVATIKGLRGLGQQLSCTRRLHFDMGLIL